jgi:Abnormal spindle-like microcephaly-assoc'd, ASPM-SPD-2-Hydin/Divergent InlB B-repeat domain
MIANRLALPRENREFPMKTVRMPATTLTTVRKTVFTLFFILLMVFGAVAQTVQSIKADPGNNNPPPASPILDLNGNPTNYQQYTVDFVAGVSSTAITFAFRNDPSFTSFSNASVVDTTTGSGNLLTNGDFSGGCHLDSGNNYTPVGWTYANQYGAGAGGIVIPNNGDNTCNIGGDVQYYWYDGAVQAYDAISQTISTTPGDNYHISFYVSAGGGSTFSALSTNGNTTGTGGNGIDVTVYAQAGLPPPAQNTLTVAEAGQGSGTVSDGMEEGINCTDTNETVTGTCSANYANGTQVTLTATLNSGSTTFGGWGGACASFGMSLTCSFTMNSSQNVTAVFNETGSPTQSGNINPGGESPGPTATFNFGGGFQEGSPSSGNDFTAQQTDTTQTLLMTVTAIPISQAACNTLVRLNPLFNTAECFVIQNGGGPGVDSPVMYAVTCQNGSCGSNANPFDAFLGSEFNFKCTENSPLLCGPPPLPFSFGPPNLTSADGLPSVGFLKGTGPDESNPCNPDPLNPSAPLFQGNQIVSLTIGDTSSKPIKGQSGGSTSCWVATYLTPGEVPTVTVAQPLNNGIYQLNQTTSANYTCAAVNNSLINGGVKGPYLTVGSCTATDSPGGPVAPGAQFDTSTTGPHTFTANVEDSALNTAASTVIYNVLGAVKSANYTTFMQGTPGSFTVTTSGFPYPAISYSPYGSLPAGVSLVDNHNGTATLSGTPTVSGGFTFWIIAAYGGSRTVQSFTLTVTAPLTVTPTSLAFGSVTVNQTAKKSVTVQNKSGKSVGIGPVTFTVTMGAKSQFTLGQACPATLLAGNSCTIGVNFTPNAKGGDAATLNIVTTAPGSPLKVPITAAGK